MVADLNTLVERVRSHSRDDGGSFITDGDIVTWLNEAQTDISARTEVLQHETSGTTSGTIPMPPGTSPEMVEILSLRLGTDDVEFVSDATWNSWKDLKDNPTNTLGRVFDKVIELYPTPTANTAYVLRYSKIPFELTQSSDEHELPLQFERKLVEFAVAQAKLKDSDPYEASLWLSRYEQGLPQVNTGSRLNFPGPMAFVPDPGPFELDQGYSAN